MQAGKGTPEQDSLPLRLSCWLGLHEAAAEFLLRCKCGRTSAGRRMYRAGLGTGFAYKHDKHDASFLW